MMATYVRKTTRSETLSEKQLGVKKTTRMH